MRYSKLLLRLFLTYFAARIVNADANGGTDCAACVLLVGLFEQMAQVHSTDFATAASMFCDFLPSALNKACDLLLERFGPNIIDAVNDNETPDLACHSIGICTQEPGKGFCHLFPLPSNFKINTKDDIRGRFPYDQKSERINLCLLPGVAHICDQINGFADEHLPIQDSDRDKFSSEVDVLRGAMWRGRDCNDERADYYPGREPYNLDTKDDSNCNGIYGVDPSSGIPYEESYCGGTGAKGVILLGDSAGAHFHIPPDYLMGEYVNEYTFQDVYTLVANEGDWPMLSSATAFDNDNSWPHSIYGPIDSIYLRMRDHNLCNHRDFQNIGVNGARSSSMTHIVESMARQQDLDHPAIVILSLIGNDVCNGHEDTIAHMTMPDEYRENMMVTLTYLDTILPNGSAVFLTGLADGRILWNTLYDRIHPIGQLNKDVTYQAVYDFLNCLEVSPCTGWMNSNESMRNFTSERAANLSAQAGDIAKTEHFQHFEVHYVNYDIQELIDVWEGKGGEAWELIEPIDGFHPSQRAQALIASQLWDVIGAKYPHVLGSPNPHNQDIAAFFGDQGGH